MFKVFRGPFAKAKGPHKTPWMSENQAMGEWNKILFVKNVFLSPWSASCVFQQCVRPRITLD